MNHDAVEAFVTARRADPDWSERLEALAVLALSVAKQLDAGDVNAQLVRELRATLSDLAPVEVTDDAFDRIAAQLSASLGNSED